MTDRQQFIRSMSRRATHLYCARCGAPPRFVCGLCGTCDEAQAPAKARRAAKASALPAPNRT